jgi:hypothetical protein
LTTAVLGTMKLDRHPLSVPIFESILGE